MPTSRTNARNSKRGGAGFTHLKRKATTASRHPTDAEVELAQLRTAVDALAEGVIISDTQGNLIHWNKAALRLHGYRDLDEVRRHVSEFTANFSFQTPEGQPINFEQWPLIKLLRGERVQNYELRVLRADTKKEWMVSYSGTLAPAPDGKMLVVLSLRDMSELRRAEAARREGEQRLQDRHHLLQTLVDGIIDPVYVKDVEGRLMYLNDALAQLCGRSVQECIGLTTSDLFGKAVGMLARQADEHALSLPESYTYEESAIMAGQRRHYLVTKARFVNSDGKVAGLIGISRDITSGKKVEQVLRHTERHLRQVMDSLLVSVLVLDVEGRIADLNATARQAMGRQGIPGMLITDLPWMQPGDESRELMRSAIEQAARGKAVWLMEVRFQQSGNDMFFELNIAPMYDDQGVVTYLILSAIDITERIRAEQRAREQQTELAHLERVQTIGHMASGLAHELNQPLAAIVNYAAACQQMVTGGQLDVEHVEEGVTHVIGEATRAGEIIRRLRDFVKKQRPNPVPVDVNAIARESVQLLGYDLRQADIVPTLRLAKSLPRALGDSTQLTQVMVNLLRNALDAMQPIAPSRRRLQIATHAPRQGGMVRVSVSDSGIGVEVDKLPRLFEAFYTSKSTGLGLGLALCRRIIEEHGGHLSARLNPRGGMTFSFEIPIAAGGSRPGMR